MTTVSSAQVKELRERTGAGMMECKKALLVSGGDMEGAIQELRKRGIAKASDKASRIAAEGIIVISDNDKEALMVEINCETDFVARETNLIEFGKKVAETALQNKEQNVLSLENEPLIGSEPRTVQEVRHELITKVGENVQIRRMVLAGSNAKTIGTYIHGNRIGVMVELDVDNKELARDIAMHIAASRPLVISPEHVPESIIAQEKEIYLAQAKGSGKPQEIIEKMVMGRLKKYLDEVSLVGQPFVKEPDITVGALLSKNRAKVLAFYRYQVGEGIEKSASD